MESAELKSGSLLKGGEYRIVKPLGQGGFGITYLAEQVSLGRKVAVKEFFMKDTCEREGSTSHVTVPTASNRELVAKFRNKFIREARMIASFDNPHIVRIHDVFEENGTAYYVMEYLPGGSLSDRVKRTGRMPENEAVDVIRKVAGALSYIHSQNVLHMDVKPSNIMFSKTGEPVLVDFGISKHYDEAGHQTSSTPVGISKGFAPLEQYRAGDIASFTPATDIYSLGATLYYLLTGTVPPDASDVNEEGLPSLPSSVSPAVNAAITSAMQPKRKDRPQSIGDFLKILDGKTEGQSDDDEDTEPVGGKDKKKDKKDPEKNPEPSPKPKRSLWIAIAAAVVTAVLCAVLIPGVFPNGNNVPDEIDDVDSVAVAVAEKVPDKKTESPTATKPQPSLSSQELAVPAVVELKSITLNKSSLELEVGETASLTVKYTPSDATDKTTTWKSTDTKVVTVSSKGKVTAVKAGSASIIAKCGDKDAYCNITVKAKPEPEPVKTQPSKPSQSSAKPTAGSISGHEWVDLDLPSGLLWATCNVGASSPSDYGSYFAWGETSTKSSNNWTNLKYCNDDTGDSFSKYNKDQAGTKDNKMKLDLSDDAARANWGGSWRMPIKADWVELKNNCTWTWTSQGGHNGYKVTGNNGNSIFLPAAGCRDGDSLLVAGEGGHYWSSSLSTVGSFLAFGCSIDSESVGPSSSYIRFYGRSVRPVSSSL